ncbi:MAG TPA: antibiotic biosynthesis monooxygenase [bacterium]|nr:antibiotic biosynthesis monooxygenase [bacterium]HPP30207.1 antibiotic biosynthesis monooxygenase [bacterium]
MIVTIVEIYVKKDRIDDFIEATMDNHINSIKEPGNLRFDVLQSTEDPCRFTLYEVYESEEAAKEHKKTQHYLKWRETVEEFMAHPRKGIPHRVIAPMDKNLW